MDKSTLEQLIAQGKSSHQIAKELNKAQTTIRYWLKTFELKTHFIKNRSLNKQNLTHKQCPSCLKILEKNEINFFLKKGKYYSYCRDCHSKKCVDRFRDYKLQCVEYKGGKCIKCGYNNHYSVLDFHHLDPSKKDFTISRSNMSFENLKHELDKTVLLCANCHREFHAGLFTL